MCKTLKLVDNKASRAKSFSLKIGVTHVETMGKEDFQKRLNAHLNTYPQSRDVFRK